MHNENAGHESPLERKRSHEESHKFLPRGQESHKRGIPDCLNLLFCFKSRNYLHLGKVNFLYLSTILQRDPRKAENIQHNY